MIIINNENIKICGECGGRCCKSLPGEYRPEDLFPLATFGAISVGVMKELFSTGKYAVDWWEVTSAMQVSEIGAGYFVRPRVQGITHIKDPSWGGTCIHLTDTGCELTFEKRPFGCRNLRPIKGGQKCSHVFKWDKYEAARVWKPYHRIIDAAIEELCNTIP